MAGEERTEPATPRRRNLARAEGDVARSVLAPAVLSLCGAPLVGIAAATLLAPWWLAAFARASVCAAALPREAASTMMLSLAWSEAMSLPPWLTVASAWLVAVGAAGGASFACGALGWSPKALSLRLSRLSPNLSATSMISPDARTQAILGLVLAGAVAACSRASIHTDLTAAATGLFFKQQPAVLLAALNAFWWRAVGAFAVVAAVEVLLARRRHAARLRMTRQEVREERAEHDGKPEVKARRKAIGARRSRALRVAAVERATAMVTNPTHVAVALRYAPPRIDVPVVVCAGVDHAAAILRAAADLHAVPIVESPELARALYARVAVDDPIPEELYAAVAAVFAWIVKTRGTLRGADAG